MSCRRTGRAPKREPVGNDQDLAKEQPALKSVKIEAETVHSPVAQKVPELQLKVKKVPEPVSSPEVIAIEQKEQKKPRRVVIVSSSDDESIEPQPISQRAKKGKAAAKPAPSLELITLHQMEVALEKDKQPAPSQEVIEQLRRQVAKLERDKQGAFRIAGEAQARVEFLESIVDKKPTRLHVADDTMDEELQKKIDDMTGMLAEYDRDNAKMKEELRKANDDTMGDRVKLYDYTCKLTACEAELAKLRQELWQANNRMGDRNNDSARIYDITGKLAECEKESKQLKDKLRDVNEDRMSALARVAALTAKLDEAAREKAESAKREEESTKKAFEKAQEVFALKLELAGAKKLTDPSSKSEDVSTETSNSLSSTQPETDKSGATEEEDQEEIEAEERIDELMRYHQLELYNVRREADEEIKVQKQLLALEHVERQRDKQMIDELTRKLTAYEGGPQQQQQQQKMPMQQAPPVPAMIIQNPLMQVLKLVAQPQPQQKQSRLGAVQQQMQHLPQPQLIIPTLKTPQGVPPPQLPSSWKIPVRNDASKAPTPPAIDPMNILAFLPAGSDTKSIPYKSASDQLHGKFCKVMNDDELCAKYEEAVKKEMLQCEVCAGKSWKGDQILAHFFSPQHTKTVCARSSSVSLAAFEHWKNKLEAIAKTAAPAAAADAPQQEAKE